jgi:protein-tyrosine-phosphatase
MPSLIHSVAAFPDGGGAAGAVRDRLVGAAEPQDLEDLFENDPAAGSGDGDSRAGEQGRSHLAAAPWRQSSSVPTASAGTRPAGAIAPGTIDAAVRRRLPLPRLRPWHVSDVRRDGDLVVTVCDLAHEELDGQAVPHWSVPDLVPAGDPESFDAALAELDRRVRLLASRLAAAS